MNTSKGQHVFEDDVERVYTVVRNNEDQYSIWPVDRPVPPGWHEVGKVGDKQTCLAHIKEIWTDLRPRSPRRAATG